MASSLCGLEQDVSSIAALTALTTRQCWHFIVHSTRRHDDNYLDKQTVSGLYCWDIHKISTIWTIKICCLPPPTQGRYNVGLWVFLIFSIFTDNFCHSQHLLYKMYDWMHNLAAVNAHFWISPQNLHGRARGKFAMNLLSVFATWTLIKSSPRAILLWDTRVTGWGLQN